jgi:hypothetical protein
VRSACHIFTPPRLGGKLFRSMLFNIQLSTLRPSVCWSLQKSTIRIVCRNVLCVCVCVCVCVCACVRVRLYMLTSQTKQKNEQQPNLALQHTGPNYRIHTNIHTYTYTRREHTSDVDTSMSR